MKHFTREDVLSTLSGKFKPSALTLETIRQFAYSYGTVSASQSLVLN